MVVHTAHRIKKYNFEWSTKFANMILNYFKCAIMNVRALRSPRKNRRHKSSAIEFGKNVFQTQ